METTNTAFCATCARPLAGPYCSQCGEAVVEPHAMTVRHFLAPTLAHETLHVDGKIWRTLRYLFARPGFLTIEYVAGRRVPYVNAVRILITAILAYSLLMPGGNIQFTMGVGPDVRLNIAPSSIREGSSVATTVAIIDRFGVLERFRASRSASADLSSDAARERFRARLHAFVQPLSFSNVLLLALALFALFRRRQPLLVVHGVFSMHVVSFVLLSTLLLTWPTHLLIAADRFDIGLVLVLAAIVGQFAYLAVAIRRCYLGDDRRRWQPALFATSAAMLLYVLNSVFVTFVQMLSGALAIAMI